MTGEVCIYCLSLGGNSRSHIFPESIGGRYAMLSSCERCNNSLGASAEGRLKECLFFAQGMVSLRLSMPDKAFQKIEITRKQDGQVLHFVDGKLWAVPTKRSEGVIVGPPHKIARAFLKWVRRKKSDQLARCQQLVADGAESIEVGDAHVQFLTREYYSEVQYKSSAFPIEILAKIAYESLFLLGVFDTMTSASFRRHVFEVDESVNGPNRVAVKDSFASRVLAPFPKYWNGEVPIDTLQFREIHRIDVRCTSNNVAYVRIVFFGLAVFCVVIGETDKTRICRPERLDRSYFFPTSSEEIEEIIWPNRDDKYFEWETRKIDEWYLAHRHLME